MARFTPELPRPEDNSQITQHPIAPADRSPELAARPGLAWARAAEDVADVSLKLVQMQQQNQFTEGQLDISHKLDAAETRIRETPGGYATAAQDYKAAYDGINQGIANSDYDAPVKARLQRAALAMYSASNLKLGYWAWQKNKSAALTRDDLAAQDLINRAAQAPVGAPSRELFYKAIGSIADSRVGTLLTKDDADALNAPRYNAADVGTYEYLLSNSPTAALNFVNNEKASPYLDSVQRSKMRMQATAKLQELADANLASTNHLAGEAIDNVFTTGSAPAGMLSQVRAGYAGVKNGAKYLANFESGVKMAQAIHGDIQVMSQEPLDKQRQMLLDKEAWANAPGDDIEERQAGYNRLVETYNQNSQLLTTDPRAYADKLLGQPQYATTTPAGEARRMAAVDEVYTKLGVTNGPLLTKAQAASAAQRYINLSASDPAGALQWLANVSKQYPKQYVGRVKEQLFQLLPPSAWILDGDMHDPSGAASVMATDHMSVSVLRNAIGKQEVGQADQAIGQAWGPIEAALGPAGDKIKPVFQKLAYNFVAHQGMAPSAAAARAQKILFGNYAFGPAGSKWMFPANAEASYGLSQQKIMDYGDYVIRTADYAGGPDATSFARLHQQNTWQFYPQTNTYVLVDANGNTVVGADGSPIHFSIWDASRANLTGKLAPPATAPAPLPSPATARFGRPEKLPKVPEDKSRSEAQSFRSH